MEEFFASRLFFGEETLNLVHVSPGQWLDYIMIAFTQAGRMPGYAIVCAVLYWCFDRKIAVRITAAVVLVQITNHLAKEYFQHPRPDPELLLPETKLLREMVPAPGYSFPSGHTMSTTAFTLSLLFYIRKKWLIAPALLFMLAVLYSRMYLGAHFPGDVAAGLLLAAPVTAVVLVLIWLGQRAAGARWLPFLIAALIIGGVIAVSFLEMKEIASYAGILVGVITGHVMCGQNLDFLPRATPLRQAAKILIGIAGGALIIAGLGYLLPINVATSFIMTWLAGFWVTFLAPLIFVKSGLART